MAVPICKACGCYMLPAVSGRPPTTCSDDCRQAWKAARQRAQRGRARALEHIGLAMGALGSVREPWRGQLRRFYKKLLAASPGDLAVSDRNGTPIL